MSVGVSAEALTGMLEILSDPYLQMHTGDPGSDGTSNVAASAAREPASLVESAPGARSLNEAVEWANPWDKGEQTITHLSAWDAGTGGNFLFSVALLSPVKLVNGVLPRLTALSIVVPTIAKD